MTREETENKLMKERSILERYLKDIKKRIDELDDELTELRV